MPWNQPAARALGYDSFLNCATHQAAGLPAAKQKWVAAIYSAIHQAAKTAYQGCSPIDRIWTFFQLSGIISDKTWERVWWRQAGVVPVEAGKLTVAG